MPLPLSAFALCLIVQAYLTHTAPQSLPAQPPKTVKEYVEQKASSRKGTKKEKKKKKKSATKFPHCALDN